MKQDLSFAELNRASTNRIRTLVAGLSDQDLLHPVGQNWTIATVLAHLAFWDRRVMFILDATERDGKLVAPEIDVIVNDIALPLLAAIPPRKAAQLAVETAETLDARLESFTPRLRDEIYAHNKRWVVRALHRNEHLDKVDAALKRGRA